MLTECGSKLWLGKLHVKWCKPQPQKGVKLREGKGRFINKPTQTGGKTYDKFFVYVPTEVARDGTFPFKPGDEVFMRIENFKKLVIEKVAPKEG